MILIARGDYRVRMHVVALFLFIICFSITPLTVNGYQSTELMAGPSIGSLEFHTGMSLDDQIASLQNDEIDIVSNCFDTGEYDLVNTDKIVVHHVPLDHYWYLTINCRKIPFNMTAFRRAIAFALDKQHIAEDMLEGKAIPLDSCVPLTSPWSIDGMNDYDYYTSEIKAANDSLDSIRIQDIDNDGWRELPDGQDFTVNIEIASSSYAAIQIARAVRDSLRLVGVNASTIETWEDILSRLYFHGDYDIVLLMSSSFQDIYDVRWLGYEFWSQYANWPYYNYPNFKNLTYDSWRHQLLHATDYESVYEAATEMQKILIYECPIIPIVEYLQSTAYRKDKFEGFVCSPRGGVANWWTNYLVRQRSEQMRLVGGTLRWGLQEQIDDFNMFHTTTIETWTACASFGLATEFYDSLLKIAWDGRIMPWLAESFTILTHQDDARVPEGNTRFIFKILDNATWSDGSVITASDVVYTLLFYYETKDHPFHRSTQNLTSVYAPRENVVYLEFNTESYWHIYSVCLLPIMQKDVLEQIRSIGWDDWAPDPTSDNFVTSGPFVVSNVSDNLLVMRPNLQYFRGLHSVPTNATTPPSMDGQSPFVFILIIGMSAAVVMILLLIEVGSFLKSSHRTSLLKRVILSRLVCQTASFAASPFGTLAYR